MPIVELNCGTPIMALLDDVLNGCGGRDRWDRFDHFEAHLSLSGSYLASKVDLASLKEIVVFGSTRLQTADVIGLLASSRRGICGADWVGIESAGGSLVREQSVASTDFVKLGSKDRWTDLDVVFYCGISIWNVVNCLFGLADRASTIEEVTPFSADGEVWRRLRISIPPALATEAREQVLYFDAQSQHRRTDYIRSDLIGGPIAHILTAHEAFSGIVLPTLRRSWFIEPDGTLVRKVIPFDLEIFDLRFSKA